MKFLLYILIGLFAMNYVFAGELVNISIYRESFSSEETVQVDLEFYGVLDEDLSYSSINIYNNQNRKINVALNIEKVSESRYYVYFDLPSNLENGTYKIKITGVNIYYNFDLITLNKEKIFFVNSSNSSISIDPGIFITSSKYNTLKLKNNLQKNQNVFLSAGNLTLEKSYITLESKEVQDIQFVITQNQVDDIIKVEYGNKVYNIPVLVSNTNINYNNSSYSNISKPENLTNNKSINAKFFEDYDLINKTLFVNESIEAPLKFINDGQISIDQIKIWVSEDIKPFIKINKTEFENINVNEIRSFLLSINKNRAAESGVYRGEIKLISNQELDSLSVELRFDEITKLRDNKTLREDKTDNLTIPNENEPDKNKTVNYKPLFILSLVILILIVALILVRKKTKSKQIKNFSYYFKR